MPLFMDLPGTFRTAAKDVAGYHARTSHHGQYGVKYKFWIDEGGRVFCPSRRQMPRLWYVPSRGSRGLRAGLIHHVRKVPAAPQRAVPPPQSPNGRGAPCASAGGDSGACASDDTGYRWRRRWERSSDGQERVVPGTVDAGKQLHEHQQAPQPTHVIRAGAVAKLPVAGLSAAAWSGVCRGQVGHRVRMELEAIGVRGGADLASQRASSLRPSRGAPHTPNARVLGRPHRRRGAGRRRGCFFCFDLGARGGGARSRRGAR